jgi:hypothetical protein
VYTNAFRWTFGTSFSISSRFFSHATCVICGIVVLTAYRNVPTARSSLANTSFISIP